MQDNQETLNNELNLSTKEEAYYYWHTRLVHWSKARMQKLARYGAIPSYLGKLTPPLDAACIHGKATKKTWRKQGS
jgi:hypothetical protein